ncbi:MAG: HesA/MoeB/ThiF family protein [Planctomycetota bacterium]|jgi:adenylyltransferase/sulfurtransferase
MNAETSKLMRYARQMAFEGLGRAGQRGITAGRALIVGVGGLGSWVAEILARSGVGFLRLADDDKVDLTNIHRQAMYDEADVAAGRFKAEAAAGHVGRINGEVRVEAVVERLDRGNIARLAEGVDLIIDGTDNFATRFLINDFAVKVNLPWIFAGVVGAEAQTMTIVPPRTACLRCVFDAPPPPCVDPTCRTEGVLSPAVAAVASIQAVEAMKILAGRLDEVSPFLLKIDLWHNAIQRIDAGKAAAGKDCPCCKRRVFDFLDR